MIHADGRRVGEGVAAVVVDGGVKLGSYDLAFVDAEWRSSVTSLEMVRSYSTLRKDVVGDFGHGWKLGITDVTVRRPRRNLVTSG